MCVLPVDSCTVSRLFDLFFQISASVLDDGVIDSEEFAAALGLHHNSLIANRVFEKFNVTNSQTMNFREFTMVHIYTHTLTHLHTHLHTMCID